MNAAPPDLIDTAAAGPAAMRGGLLRMSAFAGSLLIGLASAPLLVRHLGEVEFGRYSTALAIVAIVAGPDRGRRRDGRAARAVGRARPRAAAAAHERPARPAARAQHARASPSPSRFTAVAGYGGDLTLGVLLASVGMLFVTMQLLLVVDLQSRLRFGWAALVELARGVVGIALIIALVLAGEGTVPLLAVAIPAGLAALALTVPLVRGTTSRCARPSRPPAGCRSCARS